MMIIIVETLFIGANVIVKNFQTVTTLINFPSIVLNPLVIGDG